MKEPIMLVLGPSGAGKTTLGNYMAKHQGFLHVNLDRADGSDGLNYLRLQSDREYGKVRVMVHASPVQVASFPRTMQMHLYGGFPSSTVPGAAAGKGATPAALP